MDQGAEYQIQVAEVPGSMLTGVTFYCWIFGFYIVKDFDANIAIIANFG